MLQVWEGAKNNKMKFAYGPVRGGVHTRKGFEVQSGAGCVGEVFLGFVYDDE